MFFHSGGSFGTLRNRLQELFQDPSRTRKPRQAGLTHVLDKGMSVSEIESLLEVAAGYVDIVKFGWGTSVVIENLDAKIDLCQEKGIDIYCGGSLFELALQRGKVDDYVAYLKDRGIRMVEISDGVIELPAEEKLRYIERLARDFKVLSEVGSKDETVVVAPYRWVKQIKDELEAGAWKVITEGRESGTVGPLSRQRRDPHRPDRGDRDPDRHRALDVRGAAEGAAGVADQALRRQRQSRQHPARRGHRAGDHAPGAARRHDADAQREPLGCYAAGSLGGEVRQSDRVSP